MGDNAKVRFLGSNQKTWKADSRYSSSPVNASLMDTELGTVNANIDC